MNWKHTVYTVCHSVTLKIHKLKSLWFFHSSTTAHTTNHFYFAGSCLLHTRSKNLCLLSNIKTNYFTVCLICMHIAYSFIYFYVYFCKFYIHRIMITQTLKSSHITAHWLFELDGLLCPLVDSKKGLSSFRKLFLVSSKLFCRSTFFLKVQ